MPDLKHQMEYQVSFGDCDPARIAFYPTILSWFDRCYHHWLHAKAGGHKTVCETVGARGMGLIEVSAKFRAPLQPGDLMTISLNVAAWNARSFLIDYEIRVGDRLHATGTETRAVFIDSPMGIRAGDTSQLRTLLEQTVAPT